MVKKLKRKLEEGPTADDSVMLLKRNRSGNVVPARSGRDSSQLAEVMFVLLLQSHSERFIPVLITYSSGIWKTTEH